MKYRREIDGLRALAVLPVILFHAGFTTFSGGFVGVDVFFVISGYLITSIILADLEAGTFSIAKFYERRLRRIMPALFLVMFASLLVGYFLLMPDEFKNLGQSIVATSLSANNILLALTSGYWDLASEFKPLLHTWSLGVEEQYYIVVPIMMLMLYKIRRSSIVVFIWFVFLSSFLFANWFVDVSPQWAFYILLTRAWELALGALAAFYLQSRPTDFRRTKLSDAFSLVGLICIIVPIFLFSKDIVSPGWPLLLPTFGAVLIILYSQSSEIVSRLLGNQFVVFIGLTSYSLYLWHQPVFAYLRAYSVNHPSPAAFIGALPIIFVLSILTWKYVETPFRNKTFVSGKSVFALSLSISVLFVAVGLFLNKNYGMPDRVFSSDISIRDMDKRIYNERAFQFKKESFTDSSMVNILVVGNSFGRDFVNITIENFDLSNTDIVYRDDLDQCIDPSISNSNSKLFVEADVIVFANDEYRTECALQDIAFAESNGAKIFFIGTKDFGYNLNWLARLGDDERRNQYNLIPERILALDRTMANIIPPRNYISLLAPTLNEGRIPITDDSGRMLSTDRAHLTKYGAIYFGQKAVVDTPYGDLFEQRLGVSRLAP